MTDPVRIEIVNQAEWKAQLAKLDAAVAEQALIRALTSGAELILNDAVERCPWITHTLQRSLHIQPGESSRDSAEVELGTDVVYAPRIEFGFVGTDSRGRMYHQPARPYLRPAFDNKKDAAVTEVGAALAILIEAVL
jgi:hypothetical protein